MRMLRSFTYNNVEKPPWLFITKTNRPPHGKVNPVTMDTPGRRGSWLFGTRTESLEISFDIEIYADNDVDLREKVEYLAGWLDQGEELPLSINDEPGRYYQAVYTGGGESWEQIASIGIGSLTFFVPDPYKYGEHYNYSLAPGANVLNYMGTAPMHPKFTINFTKDSNYFAIAGPEGLVQLGAPAGVGEPAAKPRNRLFVDQMADLAPWSASGVNIDFGMQAGSAYVIDGHKIGVQNWGDNDETTGGLWHGPVLKRSIGYTVQDFRAVVDFDMNNPPASAGRVCVWLLNAAGAIMARLIFYDKYLTAQKNEVSITAGPNSNQKVILAHEGFSSSKTLTWNGSFQGRMILNRNGNIWRASIAKLNSEGRLSTASYAYDWIEHGAHLDPIAQIQIGFMKYGNGQSRSFYTAIREVLIEELNNVPPSTTKTIFQAGDKLEIDFAQGAAFLNGEYFNEELDAASRFFPFMPGMSEFELRATDQTGYTATIDYDRRYK